jgi:hypothetical protein
MSNIGIGVAPSLVIGSFSRGAPGRTGCYDQEGIYSNRAFDRSCDHRDLATIAIPKFANTKNKAIMASMKADLRNLVTAQEGFYFDNTDYAGSTTAVFAVNGTGGAGQIEFLPSNGNVLTLTYISATGYKAVMTNPITAAVLPQ